MIGVFAFASGSVKARVHWRKNVRGAAVVENLLGGEVATPSGSQPPQQSRDSLQTPPPSTSLARGGTTGSFVSSATRWSRESRQLMAMLFQLLTYHAGMLPFLQHTISNVEENPLCVNFSQFTSGAALFAFFHSQFYFLPPVLDVFKFRGCLCSCSWNGST